MELRYEYTGLRVDDLDRMVRFFVEGLGMREVERGVFAPTGGTLVTLESHPGGFRIELNWYPPGSPHAVPFVAGEALDHLGFAVRGATLEEAVRRLERAGGKRRSEGSAKLAFVDSPEGHTVELWPAG